ncbi:MAG: esterase [Microbacterium sp. 69-7]|jgi:acetyl esterase/lipase|uniref:alpha/beta hydrolase n=2 Tax=Microbacterium TaxID=33882 RepID=UPI00086AF810|nr:MULTISPECIES: alpha/beta hydrolase [unclassified Microbacterium]ODT24663.1 MAG: esterase [Microbacterium sp. SCN 69-37]OJU47734.1 MAG: esterase [Microbacterium sp. 69-7]
MTSTESLYLRDLYAEWFQRMADMDVPTVKDLFEEWHLPAIEPTGVTYEEVSAGGVPAIWANPVDAAADRVIVYTHGGGFVAGSSYSHRKLAAHLAKAAGIRALVVNYRRAPEHKYPSQLDDTEAVHLWLHQEGFEPRHIAAGGDSAGGNLAVTTSRRLLTHGHPQPAAAIAFSPWIDMELNGESLDTNDETDVLVKRGVLETMIALFLEGAGSPTDPFVNPLYQDFTGAPPTFIAVSGTETLYSDSDRLAAHLRGAGVNVELLVEPGQQHVYPSLAGRAPEADTAIAKAAAWLRPHLGL